MLKYIILFMKRPIYTIAFAAFIFLFFMGASVGNKFSAFILLVLSSLTWCYFSLVSYLSDDSVKTNISGVELKNIVPTSYFFLGIQSIALFFFWIPVLLSPIDLETQMHTMLYIFFFCILNLIIGYYVVMAKITLEFSRSEIKFEKNSLKKILDDIVQLIAQEY